MRKLIIIMILVFTVNAQASDDWSKIDIAGQSLVTGLMIVDWLQTRSIAKDPTVIEYNFVLGRRPSLDQVNAYFAASIIVNAVITNYLPKEYRPYWQGLYIGMEIDGVVRNARAGIKMDF